MNRLPRIFAPIILIALAALLAGCPGTAQETAKTNNPAFDVQLLFEHEGCRVYRFQDAGERKYYAHCLGGQSQTTWDIQHSTGKSSWTERHAIPTEE